MAIMRQRAAARVWILCTGLGLGLLMVGLIFAAFSAQYRARAVTAPGPHVSVNTPRCSTVEASMVSPVSRRRRDRTGPSR